MYNPVCYERYKPRQAVVQYSIEYYILFWLIYLFSAFEIKSATHIRKYFMSFIQYYNHLSQNIQLTYIRTYSQINFYNHGLRKMREEAEQSVHSGPVESGREEHSRKRRSQGQREQGPDRTQGQGEPVHH